MKKIINGKLYNTETAKRVGYRYSDDISSSLSYLKEELYQKKTGEFFLWGEGGPMTKYAAHHGNTISGSEKIVPLTLDEAKAWAEEYLETEEYESIFGEVEE